MLPVVVGLRTNTAVFVLLLLGPAMLLAWLGFAATVPLERELRKAALATTQRAASAFAAGLPARIDELLTDAQRRLGDLATRLATELPTAGSAAFASHDVSFGWPLLVQRDGGEVLLPAPPRDLALTFLDEWPRYRDFAQLCLDPTRQQQLLAMATDFVAPSLRARALASLPDPDALTRLAVELRHDELCEAGPLVVERLLTNATGRQRLAQEPGLLHAVPATEERRLAWFETIGDLPCAARQRLRAEHERSPLPTVRAPLPSGAELLAIVDVDQLCQGLSSTAEACTVRCEPLRENVIAVPPDTDAHAQQIQPTSLGALRVYAEHLELPTLLRTASRRQWLTAIGVLALVGVMGLGVMLVRRALRQEAEARASRDQFLANVSHDLKTPLTSLRLHAEMLTDPGLDPQARSRYAAVVQAEGARMSALVEDLLDVSALQQGRRHIEPEPVDLAAAVAAQAAAWRPLLDRDGIGLRVLTTPPTEALVDPTALARILTNLLQNAVRHGRPSRDGGPSWIELRAGPGPRLEVRDNGPGVPGALRERVFARFERAAATGEGLGLGLALSRELAQACGGTLRCLDDGSTVFELELPAVPDEELP